MIETHYLKDNIQNIQKLMSIPVLRQFEAKNLGKLLRLSKLREYQDGETIIKEGDMDSWFYFLLTGRIKVIKEGVEIANTDTVGELFGEMRIIDSLSRSASVFAVGKTTCLAVDHASQSKLYSDALKDERLDLLMFLYKIFSEYMSGRVRLANEELIQSKKEIKGLKHLLDESYRRNASM